jgi:hypothetical protein
MADQSVTWDDAVARLDATDHRPARRIARELAAAIGAAAAAAEGVDVGPLERRRRAARILVGALAVYRLAAGDPEHLASVLAEPGPCVNGDVAGTVGDRGRIARARIMVDLDASRPDVTDEQRASVAAHLDELAAALERPGTDRHAVESARILLDNCYPDPPAVDHRPMSDADA